ncbi:MAG: hypothetical protein A2X94_10615 [Bdellovibrionales bacterium GWB1_55_8]|nr:MAG: hypothetical protein A2X94_10615 [Bdellovibrionales bacterium GWB1_55_8]
MTTLAARRCILAFALCFSFLGTSEKPAFATATGYGSIAERELQVSPPSQDRIIMGSSSVLATNIEDQVVASDLNWSVSFNLRRFNPEGALEIVTGDRYDLARIGAHPMIGAEVCRNWLRRGSSWNFANCFSASASSTQFNLHTQSGFLLDHVRLTHLSSALNMSVERDFNFLGLSAVTDLGAGYLLVSQSSPNPISTASRQTPFGIAGIGLRWSPSSNFFAKASYQHWVAPAASGQIPSNHWIASGGFLF